jgi:hypothetical protein
MLFQSTTEHDDIIEINKTQLEINPGHGDIHQALESCSCITESERHAAESERALPCHKGGLI